MNKKKKRDRFFRSLGRKTTAAVLLLSLLLTAVGVLLSYNSYSQTMDAHYKTLATNIAKTAATQLDGDRLDDYLKSGKTDDEYDRMLDVLFDIKENNEVEWLYVQKITNQGVYCIMDADLERTGGKLGDRYDIAPEFARHTDKLSVGVAPTITDTEDFGWLCTAYEPVFNSAGDPVAMVGADILMNDVMNDRMTFLIKIGAAMMVTAIIFALCFLIFTRRQVIAPINRLAAVTGEFVSEKGGSATGATGISRLDIHTGDEIENLSKSIKTMENDINTYIQNLTKVTADKERISAELNVATTIQSSMLPCIFPPYPDRCEFDIFASMQPAREVGGDFYDFFLIGENKLGVVIADVSGKGVPAALFMVIARTLIKNQAQTGISPAEVFRRVNVQLCENNEANMFVTAFMGVLDLETGMFTFSNAGHNYPLIRRANVGFEWLKTPPRFVLAGMDDANYTNHQIQLLEGDRMFLYTDGVTEALNEQKELYGDDRLFAALNTCGAATMDSEAIISYVGKELICFAGDEEQADDITMMSLEFKKKDARTKPIERGEERKRQ